MDTNNDIFKNLKEISGELFDLTITSYNNGFGKSKIDTSLEHGISIPIKYYYDELNKILDDLEDDKVNKRIDRMLILNDIGSIEEVNNIFTYFTNYINGGDGVKQYENQELIFVCAGGNIFTLFIHILKDILINNDKIDKKLFL
jgi:hypothetical protein